MKHIHKKRLRIVRPCCRSYDTVEVVRLDDRTYTYLYTEGNNIWLGGCSMQLPVRSMFLLMICMQKGRKQWHIISVMLRNKSGRDFYIPYAVHVNVYITNCIPETNITYVASTTRPRQDTHIWTAWQLCPKAHKWHSRIPHPWH